MPKIAESKLSTTLVEQSVIVVTVKGTTRINFKRSSNWRIILLHNWTKLQNDHMQTTALKANRHHPKAGAPVCCKFKYRSTLWVKMILLILLILGGLDRDMEIIRPANVHHPTRHYYSLHIFCKSFIHWMN